MKRTFAALAMGIAAQSAFAAEGALKEKAAAIAAEHRDAVVYLSAVIEIEVTAGDSPARKEERKIEVLGTVIGADGLVVAPLSTLDAASTLDGRTVNTQQGPVKLSAKGSIKEVRILLSDGTEIPANMGFKDPDLDLAFIRPEKPEGVKLHAIDISNNAPLHVLDDIIILGRLGKDLNREPVVMTNELIAVVSKPRTYGKFLVQALGTPVFNTEGKFLGIGVNRFGPKNSDGDPQANAPANVILPAADIIESAAQAK